VIAPPSTFIRYVILHLFADLPSNQQQEEFQENSTAPRSQTQQAWRPEVLFQEEYYDLHFDRRLQYFEDFANLYNNLSQQMQQYFEEMATQLKGHENFENEL